MCEFSGKLIAWLDGELPAEEAAEVGRHLRGCAECRTGLSAYERLSGLLVEYCEATLAANEPGKAQTRRPVLVSAGIAAAAAIIALLLGWPRLARVHRPGVSPQAAMGARFPTEETPAPGPALPVKSLRRPRSARPVHRLETSLPPSEPAIQIAIPAEDVLPPGAVPDGIVFVSNVTIPAGGRPEPVLVWHQGVAEANKFF